MLHGSVLRVPDESDESECRADKHNLAIDHLVASHGICRCLKHRESSGQQTESSLPERDRRQDEIAYMCSSEAGPVVGPHAVLEVAFGLVDEKARLGTAGTAENRIGDDAT